MESKTAASDGEKTLSGWKKPRPNGYGDATPEEVVAMSKEIGHELKPHRRDLDFPGQYYASHAEKQLSLTRPNEPIGASRRMCADRQAYFSKLAKSRGADQVVTDPDGMRIFRPDGSFIGPE